MAGLKLVRCFFKKGNTPFLALKLISNPHVWVPFNDPSGCVWLNYHQFWSDERSWWIKQIIDGNWYKCESPNYFYLFGSFKKLIHGMLWCFTTHISGSSKITGRTGQKDSVTKREYSNVLPRIFRPLSPFRGETFRIPALDRGHTQRTLSKEAPWP